MNSEYMNQYRSDRQYDIDTEKYEKLFQIYKKKEQIKRDRDDSKGRFGQGRGRRKTSSASVIMRDGYGRVRINGKPFL